MSIKLILNLSRGYLTTTVKNGGGGKANGDNPEACQGCDDVVCCTNRSTKTPYVPPRGHHWKLETG